MKRKGKEVIDESSNLKKAIAFYVNVLAETFVQNKILFRKFIKKSIYKTDQ